MLDQSTRTAILELHRRGLTQRKIARTLRVSRPAVKRVIESNSKVPARIARAQKAEPYRAEIEELAKACKGNLVRVHEEITAKGCELSYQALTAFCRRHGIGRPPRPRAGRYHFEPGEEMQHDTSPHIVEIAGRKRRVQAASLKLCYSRMIFLQYYPTFTRFDCKLFLADGIEYFGGCCQICMIDNTHVVVLKGTGKDMIPVPEMEAFGESFGFQFRAHEVGDANRSAHVERSLGYAETNFLAGREFTDFRDLNRQARLWCDRDNAHHRRHLHASPRDLFAHETHYLASLREWTPPIYKLHHRLVDVEGYVSVNTNRYSVPAQVPIGRRIEVRETRDFIEVYEGPRRIAQHERLLEALGRRVLDPAHRTKRRPRRKEISRDEKSLRELVPELSTYIARLKKARGSTTKALRRLLDLVDDYPRSPLLQALAEAEHYGLFDLERVERMILKRISGDFFRLSNPHEEESDE